MGEGIVERRLQGVGKGIRRAFQSGGEWHSERLYVTHESLFPIWHTERNHPQRHT